MWVKIFFAHLVNKNNKYGLDGHLDFLAKIFELRSYKYTIFVSHKIKQHLKPREVRPPIVNQQSLVYQFKCDLCDAGYVAYTRRHLHQRVDEQGNASSSIGKHFRLEHSYVPNDLTRNFAILKKCKSKFDCLIYEMFLINELRPSLNVQSDSIRAKVF